MLTIRRIWTLATLCVLAQLGWLAAPAAQQLSADNPCPFGEPGAPESTFAAMGYNNNKLFVIPEWRMVVVRLGLDQKDRKITNQGWGEFLRLVGESIAD